jgi:hypothetical protein
LSRKFAGVAAWQQYSVFGAIIVTTLLGYLSYHSLQDPLLTSIFVGALGGVVHEIAQSNGKLMFPQPASDGIYLGGAYGLLIGGVSGLILAQGQQILANGAFPPSLIGEAFLAGLSLKGLSEAVTANKWTANSSISQPPGKLPTLSGRSQTALNPLPTKLTQDAESLIREGRLIPGAEGQTSAAAAAPIARPPGSLYKRLDWSRNK